MLKIALCDDEDSQRDELGKILRRVLNLRNIRHHISEFINGEELLDSEEAFDIYFLDIRMDKLTGIETAKKIRMLDEKTIIIFITALKDYVFDAFDVRAFHYILKPVDEEKLNEVLCSAISQVDRRDKFIIAKTISQTTKIYLKDIIFIESHQRKLIVHTTYAEIEYYHKLSDLEEELKNYNFFRCHKSYIVNLKYVQSYDNNFITLKNSERVFLSKYKLGEFSKAFMYYLKDEEI